MSNVLVVDDSISVRKALERILVPHNLSVIASDSAESALQTLTSAIPDLVIADVVMPGMDGFELCQTLKADEQYQHVPVLLISGIVNTAIQAQAQEVGAEGILKKPFDPSELLPAVDSALRVAKAEEAPPSPAPTAQPAYEDKDLVALRNALEPFLSKDDVQTALLIDTQGDVILQMGKGVEDEAAIASYFKFFGSAAGVMGDKLSAGDLKTMILEYGTVTLMLARVNPSASLVLALRDASVVSLARFLSKKQLPAIDEALSAAAQA